MTIGNAMQPTFTTRLIRVEAAAVATRRGNIWLGQLMFRLRRKLETGVYRKRRLHAQQQQQHNDAYAVTMAFGKKHMTNGVNDFFA